MYYQLHNHCQLVKGSARAAIYDFKSNKVYSINTSAFELLTDCKNKDFTEVMDTCPENEHCLKFFDTLTATGVGGFYFYPQPEKKPAVPPDSLEFLWLELTSGCNNKCLHCYSESGPKARDTDKVPHARWLSLITEARQNGATALQLIGGEPLLYKNWRELVCKAQEENYDFIEIFTNATLITDSDIEFFKEHTVNVATTIYADNAQVHDSVTLQPGSYQKTITAIKKLLAAGIPLRIASILMKANENQAENIIKLCTELGVEATPPDVVRPTGRGDDTSLLPAGYKKPPIKPPFYTDELTFWKAKTCHSCLAGKLAITANGDVIPCIFARNQVCGNVLKTSLSEIISSPALRDCWQLTKDSVEKCGDCEYRYACTDCRPLAQGNDSQKNWLAASTDCSYNPYTGIWPDSTSSKNKPEAVQNEG